MKVRDQLELPRNLLLWGSLIFNIVVIHPAGAQTPEMVKQATMIFVGTIVRLNAVSFPGVPASAKTAVVKVLRVIEKPPAVALATGQEVTVELKDPARFKEGTQATFYTQGWILGKGVAVREVGHEIYSGKAVPAADQTDKKVSQQRQAQKDSELQARLKNADMVVLGHVQSVRQAAAATEGKKFITEHDPNWQEATIKVESGMKGAKTGDEIVVRFPGSQDVSFHKVPRFAVNQSGLFILKRDAVTGLPRLTVGAEQVDAYVAWSQLDCLTRSDSTRVSRLIRKK